MSFICQNNNHGMNDQDLLYKDLKEIKKIHLKKVFSLAISSRIQKILIYQKLIQLLCINDQNINLTQYIVYDNQGNDAICQAILLDDLNQLHTLSLTPSFESTSILVRFFQKSEFESTDFLTPLSFAALVGSRKCFRYLFLNFTFPTSSQLQSPLYYAIFSGDEEIIQILIENDYSIRETLPAAILGYRPPILKWICEVKDPSSIEKAKIHKLFDLAVSCGNFNAVDYLIQLGFHGQYEALKKCIEQRDLSYFMYLMSNNFDFSQLDTNLIVNLPTKYFSMFVDRFCTHNDLPHLFYVAMNESNIFDNLRCLLKKGLDPNMIYKPIPNDINPGYPFIYHATINDKPEAARILLENGAEPSSYKGYTNPLFIVARSGSEYTGRKKQIRLISILAPYVNLLERNKGGNTVLSVAVLSNNLDKMIELLNCGCDINCKNTHDGNTPLHYAVEKNNIDVSILDVLLSRGADPNIPNKQGKTALQIASTASRIKYLSKYGYFQHKTRITSFFSPSSK